MIKKAILLISLLTAIQSYAINDYIAVEISGKDEVIIGGKGEEYKLVYSPIISGMQGDVDGAKIETAIWKIDNFFMKAVMNENNKSKATVTAEKGAISGTLSCSGTFNPTRPGVILNISLIRDKKIVAKN